MLEVERVLGWSGLEDVPDEDEVQKDIKVRSAGICSVGSSQANKGELAQWR
jgi:hypothetical protein